jgi:hypothetical protein
MTSLADLKLWLRVDEPAIMPSVMFKGDVEEAFDLKLTDEQWATVVERVESNLDDVCETVFELVRNEVKFMGKQWVSVDEWEAEYHPYENWLVESPSWSNGDNQGCLFETFGVEREFVDAQPINHVWSYVDYGYEGLILVAGRSVGTPIGYLVTAKPWSNEYETVVVS